MAFAHDPQGEQPPGASPSQPRFIELVDTGDYVSVVWHTTYTGSGINVYRNDDYITSANRGGNVLNDRAGRAGDVYHLVARTAVLATTVRQVQPTDGFQVVAMSGDDLLAATPVVGTDGTCLAECVGPEIHRRSAGTVIRVGGQAVARIWQACMRNPRSCVSDAGTIVDSLFDPDGGVMLATERVEQLEDGGWTVESRGDHATTLTRGHETVVVATEPGSDVFETTTVREDAAGNTARVEVVSEDVAVVQNTPALRHGGEVGRAGPSHRPDDRPARRCLPRDL